MRVVVVVAVSAAAALSSASASADVQLISRAPGGAYGNGESVLPSISADGSRVAFQSKAKNLGPATGQFATDNVFVWDGATSSVLLGGQTNTPGAPPDDSTLGPSISADGRQVAFTSGATNVLPTVDTSPVGTFRTFIDPGGSTYLVGRKWATGEPPAGGSSGAAISGDGSWAAVQSGDPNEMLGLTTLPSGYGLFRTPICCHQGAATNQLINHLPGGLNANLTDNSGSPARHVALSADGRRIVFQSIATDLVPGSVAKYNVYAWDAGTNSVELVSRASGASGAPGDGYSINPAVSADGRYVSFESVATNIEPAVTKLYDDPDQPVVLETYVRDLDTQTTTLVSRRDGTDGAPANSPGSALDTFLSTSISGDGRYVAFSSPATNLTSEDCAHAYADVFVRDRLASTTKLISRASHRSDFCANDTGAEGDSDTPSISADGTKVAFISWATNIGPLNNAAKVRQAYLADTGATNAPPVTPVAAPAAPAPGPTAAPKDTTPPKLTGLKLTPSVFAAESAKGAAAKKRTRPHRGSTISFTASEGAAVRFDVLTRPAAVAKGAAKTKPRRRKPRKVGSLKRPATSGRNRVPFSGTLGGRALKPGSYTLTATATDVAGNVSRIATATFQIVAGR